MKSKYCPYDIFSKSEALKMWVNRDNRETTKGGVMVCRLVDMHLQGGTGGTGGGIFEASVPTYMTQWPGLTNHCVDCNKVSVSKE